ncbi:adenosylcobinamide-GDP ribazoletransferase [Aquabacter sp. P-9]|uniref:adenosylcobinamide-GDP ribazoletransferase n=1 Tax=Aquabacter sediminis TaxID=3029197 RepID=UPI00237E0680|nr:adenosylcobinamide-GDP ribazoletransferase [Aquabacter sp. P-9]MDE1570348.1 adenosylcobinamide-GDP ribazoletransferase [Aquabacter sp. P-9]
MTNTPLLQDLLVALRFYTRLPVPILARESDPHAAPVLKRIAYAVPLAGAVIGGLGGLVLALGLLLKLPALPAAALAVTAMVLMTGAFHEDGLADTADGFGGGRDRAHRLDIMRDSRIGTFGAAALVLSLLLRVSAIDALVVLAGPWRTIAILAAAGAASRAAGIALLEILEPARADGASTAAGRPGPEGLIAAALSAAILVALLLVPTLGIRATFVGLLAPVAALFVMARLSNAKIGGQTGDVAGATQQVAEIAILLGLIMFASFR